MPLPEYPAALPSPLQGYRFGPQPRTRRAPAELGGLDQARAFAREPLHDAEIAWRMNLAQMKAWQTWWRDDLAHGMRWFVMKLPGRGGYLPRAVRFTGPPQYTHLGNGIWDVNVQAQVRASGTSDAYIHEIGYLVSLFAGGTTAGGIRNKDAPDGPHYAEYQASPPDLLYTHQTTFGGAIGWTQDGTWTQTGYFAIGARMYLFAQHTSDLAGGDNAQLDIEFMSQTETVRAALRIRKVSAWRSQLSYGPTLASLSNATLSDATYAYVSGHLTFTESSLHFTNDRVNYYNASFTLSGLNLADVTKMRYSNGAVYAQNISVNSGADVWLKFAPPV